MWLNLPFAILSPANTVQPSASLSDDDDDDDDEVGDEEGMPLQSLSEARANVMDEEEDDDGRLPYGLKVKCVSGQSSRIPNRLFIPMNPSCSTV